MNGRINNFDFIRFIAATLVIYTHSFALSGTGKDLVISYTNSQTHSGELGVMIFFILSGFLIALSYDRSHNPVYFLKSRVLRIMPALIVLVLITVFLIGPLVTSLSFKEYITHPMTWAYLKTINVFDIQLLLPGVFENNAWRLPFVNGSLWTLKMEFTYYIMVMFLGIVGVLTNKKFISLFLVFSIVISNIDFISTPLINEHAFDLKTLPYFVIGMYFYVNRDTIQFNQHLILLALIATLLTGRYGGFEAVSFIFIAYIIFYFVYSPDIKLNKFGKYGDFSYGLYIYSFVIQQTVTHFFGGKMWWFANFSISFVITLILSVLSWHYIEKPFLNFKNIRLDVFIAKTKNMSQ